MHEYRVTIGDVVVHCDTVESVLALVQGLTARPAAAVPDGRTTPVRRRVPGSRRMADAEPSPDDQTSTQTKVQQEQAVLMWVAGHQGGTKFRDVATGLSLPRLDVYRAIARLEAAGRVRTFGKGPGRRVEAATPPKKKSPAAPDYDVVLSGRQSLDELPRKGWDA